MRFMFTNVSGKLKSINGQLTISFEPTKKLYLTQKFYNYFTYKQLKPIDRLGQTKDLKIFCEGEEFTFNQNILCNAEDLDKYVGSNSVDEVFSVACFEHIYDLPKALISLSLIHI